MLALRRVVTIHQYLYPLSSYSIRYKSKKSNSDDKKEQTISLTDELLDFDRKDANTSRDSGKMKTRLENKQSKSRELFANNEARRKKPLNPNEKLNLAKPFDLNEKKSKREGEQKPKKTHPNIILDTESDEVRTLTRQVADSLTSSTSPSDSSNIEQELLDVLRGHRVVSKTARRTEKKLETSQKNLEQKKQFDKTKNQTRTPPPPSQTIPKPSVDVEKSTEAFSSLLRDIKLKSSDDTTKKTLDENFIRDALDGAKIRPRTSRDREQQYDDMDTRRPARDNKRRQEFMKLQRLWSGESLGIFSAQNVDDLSSKVSPVWEKYEEDELTRVSTIPPRNAFEEMIQWTKDGILWKFPVDNEQDIGPEGDVPFYEHVLLERHLQDFPNTPLIRQFMELVCVGLGRNPYWTVEQKLDHINWFREFFNEKMNIFNETVHTGAIKLSTTSTPTKPASTYKPKAAPATPAAPKVAPPVVPPPTVVKPPVASKK